MRMSALDRVLEYRGAGSSIALVGCDGFSTTDGYIVHVDDEMWDRIGMMTSAEVERTRAA